MMPSFFITDSPGPLFPYYSKTVSISYFTGDCCDDDIRRELQDTFIAQYTSSKYNICSQGVCNFTQVAVYCSGDCNTGRRRRSTDAQYRLLVSGTVTYTEQGMADYDNASVILSHLINTLDVEVFQNFTYGPIIGYDGMVVGTTEVMCSSGMMPALGSSTCGKSSNYTIQR